MAECGRPPGHHGHHGGWRTGVRVIAPRPVPRGGPHHPEDQLGADLTPRQLRVIAEVMQHGDQSAAAACMGIAYQTLRNYAARICQRTGAETVYQVPFLLGWVAFPAGVGHVA